MRDILLTTLFIGCFTVSSMFADDAVSSKAGTFTADVKISAGVAFATNVKNTNVTYGESAKSTTTINNEGTKQNTKKKSSAFVDVTAGLKCNLNNMFALGADIFYDAMDVKFELKDKKDNLANTAKIRNTYGLMAVLSYTPLEHLSFDFGAGIARATKIKDLHYYKSTLNSDTEVKEANSIQFRNKFGFVAKIAAHYVFNDTLLLGVDLKMQKVKSSNKQGAINSISIAKGNGSFKCNIYTIGATLTYNF